ncbi:MAG: S41 family peptidase [Alloprevotella sp.]|nr:S41 family peptidase [Alloprevotella sp.]
MTRTTVCHYLLCSILILLCTACITEDVAPDTRQGNFDALWRTLDEHYCFFPEKGERYGLDWDEVRSRYAPAVSEDLSDKQLFDILAAMTRELRDGHVNLYAPHDVARYGEWFDAYPANYSDSLQRIYLGRTADYAQTSGLLYRILDDNIGYVRCASFSQQFGDGNLHEVMRGLALCDGLIVDVRNNGGGLLTAAQKLASLFINEPLTAGYIRHKTGPAHNALSDPRPVELQPFDGLRWQKPLCILTNRRTYSAANAFVQYLKGLPAVTLVGDRTGGGSGLPFSSELPGGWSIRFSACPMLNRDLQCTEEGIEPDIRTDITSEDYRRGRDTIIEAARTHLRQDAR